MFEGKNRYKPKQLRRNRGIEARIDDQEDEIGGSVEASQRSWSFFKWWPGNDLLAFFDLDSRSDVHQTLA